MNNKRKKNLYNARDQKKKILRCPCGDAYLLRNGDLQPTAASKHF
jgi:hypothetical protein